MTVNVVAGQRFSVESEYGKDHGHYSAPDEGGFHQYVYYKRYFVGKVEPVDSEA